MSKKKFKIGQKIACIFDENQCNHTIKGSIEKVKLKDVYTVKGFDSVGGVLVEEQVLGYYYDGEEGGYKQERFISESSLKKILKKLKKTL